MDHSEVVRLQAAEKYVLGELPAELRDEFEEHYFDCTECANDVKHLMAFVAAGRMVLKEQPKVRQAPPARAPEKAGWIAWLRPMIAVPAMAALAAIVIFQNTVTIPMLKQRGAAEQAGVFSSSYHLQGMTRGEGGSTVMIRGTESFALDFDFTPAIAYRGYSGKLVDSKGDTVLSFAVGGEMTNREMHVVVPAGKVQPGNYALVFSGEPDGNRSPAPEVQRIPFVIERRP